MVTAGALSEAASVVSVLLIVGLVVVVGSVAYAGVRAIRFTRRLLHGVVQGAVPARATNASASRHGSRRELVWATVGDATWWANQRDRRRLWRSVATAERSVAHARRAGVPLGDLPSLTGQIRSASKVVDAGLCSGRRDPALLQQATELAAAADDVARAATAAVVTDVTPMTSRVVEAVRLELAAMRH